MLKHTGNRYGEASGVMGGGKREQKHFELFSAFPRTRQKSLSLFTISPLKRRTPAVAAATTITTKAKALEIVFALRLPTKILFICFTSRYTQKSHCSAQEGFDNNKQKVQTRAGEEAAKHIRDDAWADGKTTSPWTSFWYVTREEEDHQTLPELFPSNDSSQVATEQKGREGCWRRTT